MKSILHATTKTISSCYAFRCKEDAMEDEDEESELNKLVDILKVWLPYFYRIDVTFVFRRNKLLATLKKQLKKNLKNEIANLAVL